MRSCTRGGLPADTLTSTSRALLPHDLTLTPTPKKLLASSLVWGRYVSVALFAPYRGPWAWREMDGIPGSTSRYSRSPLATLIGRLCSRSVRTFLPEPCDPRRLSCQRYTAKKLYKKTAKLSRRFCFDFMILFDFDHFFWPGKPVRQLA